MTNIIEMPGVLRDVTHVKLDRVEFGADRVFASFVAGALVDGVFVEDEDFAVLSRSITGDDLTLFRAWAVVEEAVEDSPTYGALVNGRTVMRFVGWREYHERLSQAEWDAMLPALTAALGTDPPAFPAPVEPEE